jgi:hypothetical protein
MSAPLLEIFDQHSQQFRQLPLRPCELLAALIKLFQQPDASLVFFLRFDYFGQATREQSLIFARSEAALPRLPSFTRRTHFSQIFSFLRTCQARVSRNANSAKTFGLCRPKKREEHAAGQGTGEG